MKQKASLDGNGILWSHLAPKLLFYGIVVKHLFKSICYSLTRDKLYLYVFLKLKFNSQYFLFSHTILWYSVLSKPICGVVTFVSLDLFLTGLTWKAFEVLNERWQYTVHDPNGLVSAFTCNYKPHENVKTGKSEPSVEKVIFYFQGVCGWIWHRYLYFLVIREDYNLFLE